VTHTCTHTHAMHAPRFQPCPTSRCLSPQSSTGGQRVRGGGSQDSAQGRCPARRGAGALARVCEGEGCLLRRAQGAVPDGASKAGRAGLGLAAHGSRALLHAQGAQAPRGVHLAAQGTAHTAHGSVPKPTQPHLPVLFERQHG